MIEAKAVADDLTIDLGNAQVRSICRNDVGQSDLKSLPLYRRSVLVCVHARADPPTFSGTSMRLSDAKRIPPPLLAKLLKSLALSSVLR